MKWRATGHAALSQQPSQAGAPGALASPPARRRFYYGWLVAGTVALLLAISAGVRFLFGVVLKPVSEEFGWSRAVLATAVTINVLLLSALQPVVGWVADRWGSRRVLLVGVAATALMTLPLTFATRLWQIYLLYGILASVAFAATSPVNTTKLVEGWFTKRRALALSIATSGSAFGQLAVVPVATWIALTWTWRTSYWVLGAVALLVMLPLGWFVVRDAPPGVSDDADTVTAEAALAADVRAAGAPRVTLREALRTPSYWQLSFGFFVCGFTMSFTSVHMVPYILDMPEHSQTTMQAVASSVLAIVGGCSIVGSLAIGYLADRVGSKPMLALTYFLRGLAFMILLLARAHLAGIVLAAIVLGISWTSTTPLTSAISAEIYGRASLGAIFGCIFTAMNVGSGVGAWLAGLDYDLTGNYQLALILNGLLGFAAAATILAAQPQPLWPSQETPVVVPPSAGNPHHAIGGFGND